MMRRLWPTVTMVLALAACAGASGGEDTPLPPLAAKPGAPPSPYTVIYPAAADRPSLATFSTDDMDDRVEIYCAQYGRAPVRIAEFVMDGASYVQFDCVSEVLPTPEPTPGPAPEPAVVPLVPAAAS